MSRTRWIVGTCGAVTLTLCSAAAAEDSAMEIRSAGMTFQPAAPASASPAPAAPMVFGAKGQEWWTVGLGYANDLSESSDFNLRGAYSNFLADRVEFSLELNLWYFDQPGDNAWGINPAFLFRWHFYQHERWTIFADVGIGLLFTSDDVPTDGTSFNFTPRAGAGFTYQLRDDAPTRLQAGLRWHHISNARIIGDTDNPSRDGVMVYAGLMFPF